MSGGVVVGIVLLRSPWADGDAGVLRSPAVTVRRDDDLPMKTVLVRIDAPQGGCWSATIDDDPRNGCGSQAFPLAVEGSVNIFIERLGPAERPITVAIEADGRAVLTVGPTTTEYSTLNIAYWVPDSE